jgi:hypothetical protein
MMETTEIVESLAAAGRKEDTGSSRPRKNACLRPSPAGAAV